MYNPEEDIISHELLAQSLALSTAIPPYRVYFNKDTGDILSITNEPSTVYDCFVEFEFDIIKNFLNGVNQFKDFYVTFIDQNTPTIISKYEDDISAVFLTRAPLVTNWDSMFTIENYPLIKQWGFQIRQDQKEILKKYNLNTTLEIYVIDKRNMNFIYRTIKITVNELINKDKEFVQYLSNKEGDVDNITVYVKQFFSTIGYQILYDTNS
jgi:citrate lyase gamma subunit